MKKIVKIFIVVVVCAFFGFCVYHQTHKSIAPIQLKQTNYSFEISQNYSTNLEDYIDFTNVDENQKQDILNNASIHITDPTNEFPLRSGYYSAYIQYDEQRYFFTITITDNEAPVFVGKADTIHVPLGYEIMDYTPFFDVNDQSQFTVSYDSHVDFYTPGQYEVIATATDSQGNQSSYSQSFTVDWVYTVDQFNAMWLGVAN